MPFPAHETMRVMLTPARNRNRGIMLRRCVYAAAWSLILAVAALRFLHLTDDFPNHSPWATDQAKFTDEGWYSDAAIRHALTGNWYLRGDFNPAAAVPVWPAQLAVIFHFTGVSLTAARALSVAFSLATLALVWLLVRRYATVSPAATATLCVLLAAVSPFEYAFSRLATLESSMIFQFWLVMLLARILASRRRLALLVLPLLIVAMVLTKTTAVVFLPVIFWLYWSAPGRSRSSLVRALLAVGVLPTLWFVGYALLVRQLGYGPDFAYFFDLNGMPPIDWPHNPATLLALLRNGLWVDRILYPLSALVLVWSLIWRRSLWRNSLYAASWIALATQALFLFTRQDDAGPRYFLGMLIPLVIVFGLAIDQLQTQPERSLAYIAVVAAVGTNLAMLISFQHHREQQLLDAGLKIRRIVDADPAQNRLMLGVSAGEMSLITGVPSLNDYFGTEDLAPKLIEYRPGWYLAWNGPDPDNAAAFAPFRIEEAARYTVFDNTDRSTLILYKLLPRATATQDSLAAPAR
jgi:hypothetical protein